MKLITPFDFLEMLPMGRSLAVVGNAPSIQHPKLGQWIDSHDIVVRFNECALREFAPDIGMKTDIFVTNPFVETRTRPMLDGGNCRVVVVIFPQNRHYDRKAVETYIGPHSVLFTFAPDIRMGHVGPLTTGAYALGLLPRLLRPSQLSVTGFTCFFDDSAHHYWEKKAPPGVEKHDHLADARAILSVIPRRWSEAVTVTSELAWLARRVGISLDKRVAVKNLPDAKWLESV